MPDAIAPLSPAELKAVRLPLLQVGAIIFIFWLLYALRVLADVDVLNWVHHSSSGEPTSSNAYLIVATVVTVFGIPLGLFNAWSNLRLARNGVRVEARFVSRSMLRKHGTGPVTFEYEYGGVTYRKRRDVPTVLSDRYDETTRIPLIVDPRKPNRCMFVKM